MFRTFVFTLILGALALTGCGQLDARILGMSLSNLPSIAAYPKVVSVDADVTNASDVGVFSLPRFTTAQVVPISVHFSGAVDVTGTPTIELETGTVKRKANYASGSGTSTLVFEYSVVAGDSTATLDYTSVGALDLNGGTITPTNGATGTVDEVLKIATLPTPGATNSLAATTPILVRTIPEVKTLTAPDTDVYLDGTALEVIVKYDQPVTVTGNPSITIQVGSNSRVANYVAKVSASELLFRYAIIIGDDDTNGIDLPTAITMTGATVENPANEAAVTTLPVKDTTGILTYTSALTAEFLNSSEVVSESAGDIYVPVQLSAPAPIPFKVAIQTSGEATSDDYTLMTPELQFAAGESSKTIHIKIKNDTIAEPEKRIRLVLSKNSLGSGGVRSFHEIHLKDDDGVNTTRKVVDFRNGAGFWCALYDDKNLKCWGSNAFYNLGTGNMVDAPSIPTSPLLTDVESFDIGNGVGVCAVTTSKDLWCWGRFLGNDVTVPTKFITGGVKKAITMGNGIIYLNDSNELWAWGTDSQGVFATGSANATLTYANRVKINLASVEDFWGRYTGNNATVCAINTSKSLYCWGTLGAVGGPMGVTTQYTVPSTPIDTDILKVSFNYFSGTACFVKDVGGTPTSYCWGDNYWGYLFPSSSTQTFTTPTLLSNLYKDVMTVREGACAITAADSSLYCWGNKFYLPTGEGSTGKTTAQLMISGGVDKFLPNSYFYTTAPTFCVLMTSGDVQCWGSLTGMSIQYTPMLVLDNIAKVALSDNSINQHACLVTSAGGVSCWGTNTYGEIGDRTTISRVVPTEAISRNQVQVSTARTASCALSSYGEVRCWGRNYLGSMGLGTGDTNYTSPTVLFSKDVQKIQLSEYGGCALKNDGSLWCWGYNQKGQFQPASAPVPIVYTPYQVKSSGVKNFTTKSDTTCMITTDDELFCWGNNQTGALGNGSTSTSASATLPTTPILTDVESVAITGNGSSSSAVCAIKTNKDMHCWGQSYYLLGLGSSLTPPTTPQMTNVKKVESNGYTMCAIQGDDNQLQCWGENTSGLVGNGLKTQVTFANRFTVFSSGVTDISMGPVNFCAVVDGQMKCWGDTTKLLGIANSVALPRTVFGLTD